MFSFLVSSLTDNKLPDQGELRKRFELAMVKKNGVLGLPYHFWQNDPKINPLASHMLWAAILLEDDESLAAILSLIHKETIERLLVKDRFGQSDHGLAVKKTVAAYVDQLNGLVEGVQIAESVRGKCLRAEKVIAELMG